MSNTTRAVPKPEDGQITVSKIFVHPIKVRVAILIIMFLVQRAIMYNRNPRLVMGSGMMGSLNDDSGFKDLQKTRSMSESMDILNETGR